MKYQRKAALILTFSILISLVLPFGQAFAEDPDQSLRKVLDTQQMEIAPGATYTWYDMRLPQGLEKVHMVEFDPKNPSLDLQPGKTDGKVYGMQGVTKMASDADQAGNRVVAAINGDYYDMSTGVPLGLFMGDGEILVSPPAPTDWLAFGMKNDGSTIYGFSPELKRTLSIGGKEIPISDINRMRNNDEVLMLYTSSFHTSTMTNNLGDEVVLDILEGEVKSGKSLRLKVAEIRQGKGNSALKAGQVVLSASGKHRSDLAGLKVGDIVTASFELEDAWKDVKMAIGGSALLIKDGVVQPNDDRSLAPRVGIGTRADGSIVMMEIDGRSPGFSEGVSTEDLAHIMKDAGVVNALNLDGGGSATFVARLPGDSQRKILNLPSDGGERKTSNGLLLVNKAPEDAATQLVVQPNKGRVLVGSSLTFKSAAVDTNLHPASTTAAPQWTVDPGMGSIDASGKFTAGNTAGTTDIHVRTDHLTGKGQVEVVDELTELRFPDAVKSFAPGSSNTLTVSALLNEQKVQADNGKFQWRVEGPIGTINDQGVFTATQETDKSGKIFVQYKNVESSMEVKVGLPPVILEDYENGVGRYKPSAGARFNSTSVKEEMDEEYVRFGTKSAKLEYDFKEQIGTSGAYIETVAGQQIQIPGYPEKLSIWVYGDNQKHWLRAQLRDGNNGAFSIDFVDEKVGVDFKGWRYLEAVVPKGKPLPLTMDQTIRYMETKNDNKTDGVIYVDQLRALYGPTTDDFDPPIIKDLSPSEGSVVKTNTPKIQAFGEDDGYDPVTHPGTTLIDPDKIRLYIDGVLVQHTLYPPKGQIHYTPNIPLADGVHQAKLKIRDLSGNRTEKEWTFTVETGSSKMIYDSPKEIYAGNTYMLDIRAIKASNIGNAQVKFDFDLDKVEDLQVLPGSKLQPDQFDSVVDKTTGAITLSMNNIYKSALTDQDMLGQIQYRVKKDASKTAKISFESGMISFLDTGDTSFGFFGLPIEATVKNHLKLSWNEHGIVQGLDTTFKVVDEQGNPTQGAQIMTSEGFEVGVTNEQGELVTTALTGELKAYKLQAVKDTFYSEVKDFKVSKQAGSPTPYNISVTMGVDTTASRAFTWHTDPLTEGTQLEVVKESDFTDFNGANVLKFTGSSYMFNTHDVGTVRVHKAVADQLEPNTSYIYRVGDGQGNYSSTGTFKTTAAKGDHTKFIFLSDSQATDEKGFKLWGDILKKAMSDHPDTEFVVHGGDLVENGYYENEWNMWFNAAQGTLMNTTIVPVVGNHEVTGTRKMEDYLAHFNHPQNGIDSLKGSNFSFDYKNAHFVVLNSEADFEEQREWLRKDLASTTKKWKIVAFHRGPYGSIYDSEHIRKVWTPIFDEFQVDVVMNGHDHVYLRTYPMKNNMPVGEGEGTTYIVGGASGPKFYTVTERSWQKVTDGEQVQMYVAVEINGDEMNFVVKTVKDRIVDQFTLKKVLPPQAVVIDQPEVRLATGESVKLNATVLPQNASNKGVTWSVYHPSADDVVTVSSDGIVTANKLGTATVRATSVVDSVYADSKITVDRIGEIKVDEVRLDVTEGRLTVGQTLQLQAKVLPENASHTSVIWSVYGSEPLGVAEVTSEGIITAKHPGTAVIRAMSVVDATKYADFQLTVEDTVTTPQVDEVRIGKTSETLQVGQEIQLKATVLPERVDNQEVTWSISRSDSAGIVSVSTEGLVKGLKPGTAFIRATSKLDPSKFAEIVITVEKRNPPVDPPVEPSKPNKTDESAKPKNPEIEIDKQGVITVHAKVNQATSAAEAELSLEMLKQALEKVQADAKGVKMVQVQVTGDQGSKRTSIVLPSAALTEEQLKYKMSIITHHATLTVGSNLLANATGKVGESVRLNVGVADLSKLPTALQEQLGNRSAIQLTLEANGKPVVPSDSDAFIRLSIPYKPAANELQHLQGIVIWSIDKTGKVEAIPNSKYDPVTGTVQFEMRQFADAYAVAFVHKTFADIASYTWAKRSIETLAARDIIKGVNGNEFAPAQPVTRADFVTMLVRMLDLKASITDPFTDVDQDAYYYEAIGIAKSLGIIEGSADHSFKPLAPISRQDMSVISARLLNKVQEMPLKDHVDVLSRFEDRDQLSGYAADSMASLIRSGLIQGSGNLLNPRGYATRAEIAVFMERIMNKIWI